MSGSGPTDDELAAIEKLGIAGLEDLDVAYDAHFDRMAHAEVAAHSTGRRQPPKPTLDWYDEHQK